MTAAGDQRTAGSPNKVEVIYARDDANGVTASFTKDSTEVKPGQKRSGPLLMFLNKGEFYMFIFPTSHKEVGFSHLRTSF